MKKMMFVFIILILISFTGCSQNNNEVYVKNISFNNKNEMLNITIQSYDFSDNEENYIFKTFSDSDKNVLSIVLEEDYNFRLCENVIISEDLLKENLNNILLLIHSLKIPPNTDILCCSESETEKLAENVTQSVTKLYDFSQHNNKYSGVISMVDDNGSSAGALIIGGGNAVKHITENNWKVLNILTGKISYTPFLFNENLYCKIENISCFYCFSDCLEINICFTVNDIKGIPDSIDSDNIFKESLKAEMENIIYTLYNDDTITRHFNLNWYCQQKGVDCPGIKVNIKMM